MTIRSSAPRPRWHVVAGATVVGGYVTLTSWAVETQTYDVWGALLVAPALLLISAPMIGAAARRDGEPWLGPLLACALALKLVSSLARWAMAFSVYEGVADAAGYDGNGERLSEFFRHGDFTVDIGRDLVGTGFIRVLTGLVYVLTGPTIFGGYLVFSWMSFWGLYFSYRAYRISVPEGDHRRYALLIFFLPSALFWPSGIGKEAWMILCIGATLLGTAKVFAGATRSLPVLALGLTGTALVRPHVTALLVAAITVGYLLHTSERPTPTTPVIRILGVAALVLVTVLAIHRTAQFFELTDVDAQSVTQVLDETAAQTRTGDSSFQAPSARSPQEMPMAVISVLFRPFPWEAHNAQALLASAEGMVLLVIAATSWRRLSSIRRFVRPRPYVTVAVTYLLLFVYAFSTFGNFGILARERVQALPFLVALLALPRSRAAIARRHTISEHERPVVEAAP